MRPNKELPKGGTIADRILERNIPRTPSEAVQQLIEDWEIVKEAYKECEEESPTYMQMYAMTGSIRLVDDTLNDLRGLLKTIEEMEG